MRKLPLIALLASIAGVAHANASLTWTAPTQNTDGSPVGSPITYNVYQGAQGAPLVKTLTGVQGLGATVTRGLTPGSTQCFAVTAVVANQESAQSATACLTVPLPAPNAPINLKVAIKP